LFHQVNLVHQIEEYTSHKMELSEEVTEDEVIKLLNPVTKALRLAQLRLLEVGFNEQVEMFSQRKKESNKKRKRKLTDDANE